MRNYELYYEQLQIESGADEDTIKKAYKKLALKFHPDKNQGNPEATKRFLEIGTAYEKLIKMLRGEESDDEEGGSWEYDEKEAELEMLRRELDRERKKEKRRKEQERWEDDFKMEQMKKRMAREREERDEEYRLKEEQVKRERMIREHSMKKRNDRFAFLRRANTTSCFFSSYSSPSTFSSYSSYASDGASPTNSYSYSANLASKYSTLDSTKEEGQKSTHTDSAHYNGESDSNNDNPNSEPSSSFKSSYTGPGLSFSEEYTSGYTYTTRRKYNSADPILLTDYDKKDTPSTSTVISPPVDSASESRPSPYTMGERLSTRSFPNSTRNSVSSPSYGSVEQSEPTYLPFSSYRKTATDFSYTSPRSGLSEESETAHSADDPFCNPRAYESVISPPLLSSYSNNTSDYRHSRSSSRRSSDLAESTHSTESPATSNLYDLSSFSSYLNSTLSPRYSGSRGTSPIFSPRADLLSPTLNTTSSHSTNDLISEGTYSDNGSRAASMEKPSDEQHYTQSSETWSRSLPKRKVSNRLQEQLEWEKQFFRESERKRRAREEEEARDEERLRLEMQNQQIKLNQKAREKQRWEESFAASFSKSPYDDMNSGYRPYSFRNTSTEPSGNGTSSYTFRYSTGFTDSLPNETLLSTSPDKLYRNSYSPASSLHTPEPDRSFTPEVN